MIGQRSRGWREVSRDGNESFPFDCGALRLLRANGRAQTNPRMNPVRPERHAMTQSKGNETKNRSP